LLEILKPYNKIYIEKIYRYESILYRRVTRVTFICIYLYYICNTETKGIKSTMVKWILLP